MTLPSAPTLSSGVLLVNKPAGPTSYDIIRWLKRQLPGVKIGHSGTLDPIASGLLIVLLGRATKQQSEYMGHEKIYRCRMKLGESTDTGDTTGQIRERKDIPPLTPQDVEMTLRKFVGTMPQTPPMYSAIKVGGTPLYKLARKGKSVERQPRSVTISSIHMLGFEAGRDIEFRATVSAGTYVRTLVEDIAAALGTVGVMTGLIREQIGPYSLDRAVDAETMRNWSAEDVWSFARRWSGE